MSGCRRCGQPITWARRGDWEGARWLPPLEIIGQAFTVDFGPPRQRGTEPPEPIATESMVYRIHECKQQDIDDYNRRQLEQRTILTTAENGRLSMYEYAMQRECVKCGSAVGEQCVNLSVLQKTGMEEPTRWPHPARAEGWFDKEKV